MRSNGLIFIAGLLFIILTDTLLFLQLKNYIRKRSGQIAYIVHSLLFVAGLVLFYKMVPRLKGPENYYWIGLGIGILFLFYLPKIIFLLLYALSWPLSRLHPSGRKKSRYAAAAIAILCFLIILYSITFNRYNYKIETTRICFPELPAAFENFKIIQLSDLHLGSHSRNYKGITRLVEQVNNLRPDVILFTGDMVNNFASELTPWIKELSRLKAGYGKYAVTGNHDYGHYVHWKNPGQEKENLKHFYLNMKKAGFQMLNNTNIPLIKSGDTLIIAGVENWGNPPFPRYGKLTEALKDTGHHFVILLSHDPSHWKAEVQHYSIPLTLSGHTHAMQMGIKIGKLQWSPAQWIYPEYDGLYRQGSSYLYVSRGQGYLGFPGRIGLRPQIDQIILLRNCNN